MTTAAENIRDILNKMDEYTDPKPFAHVPDRKGKSHVVKKQDEVDKDDAIEHLQSVITWLETNPDVDDETRRNLIARVRNIAQKLSP